ncbi:RNA polymerase sigma factor [Nocardioides marmoribigeumensis]|uniref:RNA polymerase sigma-70 factor (ECF subfamily) n=1 Tax=Nocardioides marmoribigeumensis TaxID=433649 RepID=A0ABU2BW71_9ACTN|nr:SigE family RNA polymerase sigma factor [Nocardioides marmoribigeumensis]MDR7362865.1 RNA polymerase sigma-70 factor (ECF subfamily) [Nocardioides marmoribigeumensis]
MDQRESLLLTRAHRSGPVDGVVPSAYVDVTPGQLLAEVFHGGYRRLVVQLYAVTGDLAEAEDVVQEAFVRAAALPSRLAQVDNPEAWLRTVALNLHRNRVRKVRGWLRVRRVVESEREADLPGPEEHLDVVRALRRLPARHREVLALHYLSDLSVAEVAEALQVPEGTVKSRLSRARDALDQVLREGDGDDAS